MSESEREALQADRRQMKREWGAAYDGLSGILFTEDPVGINFETNTDEYEPEVGTILLRLPSCRSREEVREVVHQEFVRWFDVETAGAPDSYDKIAERIWNDVLPAVRAIGGAAKEAP